MSKVKHSVVLLIDPTVEDFNVSLKAGNMLLNRFCIDEDAAFESSGVYYYSGEKASTIAEKEKGKRKYILTHRQCQSSVDTCARNELSKNAIRVRVHDLKNKSCLCPLGADKSVRG